LFGRRDARQVGAAEQLHDVERGATLLAVVVDLDDVRVRQLAEHVVLALKQRSAHGALALALDGQALVGDLALTEAVVGEVDGAHPARGEPCLQLIASRAVAPI
jgi:hypothetical protein